MGTDIPHNVYDEATDWEKMKFTGSMLSFLTIILSYFGVFATKGLPMLH